MGGHIVLIIGTIEPPNTKTETNTKERREKITRYRYKREKKIGSGLLKSAELQHVGNLLGFSTDFHSKDDQDSCLMGVTRMWSVHDVSN